MAGKPTLVMVPGFMCDDRLFTPQIEALRAEYDIHVLTPSASATSVEEMAVELLGRAPVQFALLGLSMGGIVAMEIIKRAPERVTRLALLDCNPHPDTTKSSAERMRQISLVKAGHLLEVMATCHILKYLVQGQQNEAIINVCSQMADNIGSIAFINHQTALINRSDQCSNLPDIKVPTLIACGANDQLCPPSNHQLMRSLIPNSSLALIPEASHLPTLEQPEFTISVIRAWL